MQNLYYYSLACSPTDVTTEPEIPEARGQTYARKTRLRSYQPPQAAAAPSAAPVQYSYAPQIVHSASTSPMHMHVDFTPQSRPHQYSKVPQLPSFGDLAWTQPARSLNSPYAQDRGRESGQPSVPSAPFANAGPPGVVFHSPAAAYSRGSPSYASQDYWGRARRL
jgi:hypothetical protein